jgi:hypothetical protein
MSHPKSDPPKSALWILQNCCPGGTEALTGDLLERFREGQTRGWFWRPVLIACVVGLAVKIRSNWPDFCYAIAGTAMPFFLSKAVHGLPDILRWYELPWPGSQLTFELSREALLALAALPVLAAALVANRTFRWTSLFLTAVIDLVFLALVHFSWVLLWLWRPVPGHPYLRSLVALRTLQLLSFFSTFLVAAWLGCTPARKVGKRSPDNLSS